MFDRALNTLMCVNCFLYGPKKRYFKVRQIN